MKDKIKEKDVDIEKKEPKKTLIKNLHTGKHKVFNKYIMPGGVYEITEHDKKDEDGILRVENAIKHGRLGRI